MKKALVESITIGQTPGIHWVEAALIGFQTAQTERRARYREAGSDDFVERVHRATQIHRRENLTSAEQECTAVDEDDERERLVFRLFRQREIEQQAMVANARIFHVGLKRDFRRRLRRRLLLRDDVVCLDSGCVWGRKLSVLRLEDRRLTDCDCSELAGKARED